MSIHNPQKRKKHKRSQRSARRRPPRRRPKNLRAPHKRASRPQFVQLFSLAALDEMPLSLDIDLELPPFPRQYFRSRYRPCSRRRLRQLLGWLKAQPTRQPSCFELALHLVDFEPLRPLLLYLTLDPSRRGATPFDPLSLLLVCLWKINDNLPWQTVASHLAHPQRGAFWRALFGFSSRDTPAESTLRAFREEVPDCVLNDVQGLFLQALHRAGLLPPTDKTHGYIIVGDGQLHQARSRHRCHHATETCYMPTSPEKPRPCPADQKTKGRYACACDQPVCAQRCALAPRLDPEAGFIIYSRQKKKEGQKTILYIDKAVFGYRSMTGRLVDWRFSHAWNGYTDVLSANTDEGAYFPSHFQSLYANLPQPTVGDVLYDSACGERACLDTVYDLGGIPLFDIQRDPSDQNEKKWLERGYDDHGRPFCHQGFLMTYQGIDYSRPRARWVCNHACRQSEQGEVAGCEYLQKKRGQRVYIQRCLPDQSYRLARLVPHGSKSWKRRTRWRNLSESGNSSLESKGLLRLPDYGRSHAAFLIVGADLIENLCTLARLVYEATLQDERFQAREGCSARQRFRIGSTPTASTVAEAPVAEEVVEIG